MYGVAQGKLLLTILLYVIAYAIDPLIITVVFSKLLKPKHTSKWYNGILCFGGIYSLIWIKQALFFGADSNSANRITSFIFIYIVMIGYFAFRESIRRKIIIVVSCYIIAFSIEVIFSAFFLAFEIEAEQLMTFGLKGACLSLLMRITDLLVFLSIRTFFQLIKEKASKLHLVMIYITLLALSGIALVYYSGTDNLQAIFGIYCIQALIVILSFAYIAIVLRNVIHREQEAINRARLSESKAVFLNYSHDIYEEIKEIRHDTKRHYRCLMELSRHKEYKTINKYLEELNEQLEETGNLYICDNLILQVALSHAQKIAKRKQIQMEKSITVNTFPFTESELNSIITNLLDNALEAASKAQEGNRYIRLEIRKINAQEMMLYCENTYNIQEYALLSFFGEARRTQDNQGYGTKVVRKIVKQYRGSVLYWNDKEKFYAKIIVRGNE